MAHGLTQSHGLCPAPGLPPHAPGCWGFYPPQGEAEGGEGQQGTSCAPSPGAAAAQPHPAVVLEVLAIALGRANSLCFSPQPRSKESKHAYENTLEPEERVVTTAM